MPMRRTFLLGLDGATFDILDPYVERGLMPTLGGLIERGVRARLDSIVPALTPPAWTTVMTGKRPGQHGVFDFFQKEEPTSIHYRFANSQDVRAATIWQLVGDAGGTSMSVNFPLMFPAPPIEGRVVPGGMMPWRQLRLGCHPAGLFNRLKQVEGFAPKELLDMELEVKATEGAADDEHLEYVDLHIRREEGWGLVAKTLLEDEVPDLVGVLFDGVDKLQHLTWRFIDPRERPAEPTEWEAQMIEAVERYFVVLDGIIADLLALVGEDATVIVVSDHGFGGTQDVFHVNTWLEQQGLLHWADGDAGKAKGDGTAVGFQEVTRHVRALDWSKTVAYAATPSAQGITIVDKVPGTEDPMPDDVRRDLRKQIADGLREVRRPRDGQPVVEDTWMRDEAFPGPLEAIGPDVSILLNDCGTISILPAEEVVVQRPDLRGHHRPDGVLIAAGPEIRKGAQAPPARLADVAPLVLHALDLPVPDDMVGQVPEGVFEPAALEARPIRFAEATAPVATADAPDVELDEEDQASVMKRLKALGYVE